MLNLDPGMMIWAAIVFLFLLFVLSKTAWKPILNSIAEREKTIKDSLDRAEQAKQEAEKLFTEHSEKMKAAEGEVQKMLKESKELAEKNRESLVNQTRIELDQMRERAKQEIEKEKENALITLRAEVVDLTIEATKKIIGETLDEKSHRKLISDYIDQIPETTKN